MLHDTDYHERGRTLMVAFHCGRCGKTRLHPLKEVDQNDPRYRWVLHNTKLPIDWTEGPGGTFPVLCDTCSEKLRNFLNPEKVEDNT